MEFLDQTIVLFNLESLKPPRILALIGEFELEEGEIEHYTRVVPFISPRKVEHKVESFHRTTG